MRVYNSVFSEQVWKQVNPDSRDLLDDYLLELKQRRLSGQTIYQYRADLKGFLCWVFTNLENRSVLELGKKDFRKYSLHLVESGVSNARHNRVLSIIRSMMGYAESDDDLEYDNNAVRKIKGLPKEPVKEIVFLTDLQVITLYERLVNNTEYQKAALLMMAYDSAGRRGELAQVEKHSFLDPARNHTNKVIGKRRKPFSLLYFSGTKQAVAAWLKQRGDDRIDSLWVVGSDADRRPATSEMLYHWFKGMRPYLTDLEGKEADFGPHSMRHCSLTNYGDGTHYVCREMGISGFPIDKLRLIAHHDSASTTQGYLPDTSNNELEKMFGIKMVI